MISVTCHCGSPASLRSNALLYNGREYGNGKAWICERFPDCRGSVGTHPNGDPLGTIPDEQTKKLRIYLHSVIDPLWRNADNGRSKGQNRGSVYGWLRRIMDMTAEECHIGMFDKDTCMEALKRIRESPYRPHIPTPPVIEEEL